MSVAGHMNSTMLAAAGGIGCRPPFTAAQWQELEHQALIYKYLTAGMPVPPELLIPIQRSFEALPGQYYHHPACYCSYYGKKLDPEPGRCRRTDGKKWRCSKDAHPDSKYCERHMHRGRNRSRKPVESQSSSQLPSSSTATSPTPSASSSKASIGGGFLSTQHAQNLLLGASSSLQLPLDPAPIGNRYFSGVKPSVDGHTFSEMSGTVRGLGMNFMERSWQTMLSRPAPSFTLSRPGDSSTPQIAYLQLSSAQELGQVTVSSVSRPQQRQHSFNWSEFDSVAPAKHEGQFLRAFFDERPKSMDSWSDLEEERSNRVAFPKTQLSMSFPLASADYPITCSKSPNSEPASTVTLMPEM